MNSLRRIAALATLILGFSTGMVYAQAEGEAPAEEGASSGNPLYGYVGTAFIGAGALFILCKSARR